MMISTNHKITKKLAKATAAGALLVASSLLHAASLQYTGGDGGLWSVGSNWDDSLVPTNGDDVTFTNTAANTTSVVDVEGRTYHATTGANLPTGGSLPDGNAQMYMIMTDLPMINLAYTNMNDMGSGLDLLPTVGSRWRGNPNDAYRVISAAGDYADFSSKYQLRDAGPNQNMHNNRTKTEGDAITPQVAFDMPDISGIYSGATLPKLYIAHDSDTARPLWLSSAFTDSGKTLGTNGASLTWNVFEREISDVTAAVNDSRGWISDGGALASLTIEQSTAGVTQTVQLGHNLSISSGPVFNVSAGNAILDVGSYELRVFGNTVVSSGATILLNGGEYGRVQGSTTVGSLTIQGGGRFEGTGFVNPGQGNLTIDAGGTLAVGSGELGFNFPHGSQFVWNGAIIGNGVDSVLNLGAGFENGQLKDLAQVGPNASIAGITELKMNLILPADGSKVFTFGRFGDPSLINMETMALSNWTDKTLQWEIQSISGDVADSVGTAGFKLGSWEPHGGADLQLVDSGTVADDFAYIGQLVGLSSTQRIDLNDQALLTDMSAEDLGAILAYFDNTGSLGAPEVKAVQLGWQQWYYYVAPSAVTITQIIPEPHTALVLLLGLTLTSRRRR